MQDKLTKDELVELVDKLLRVEGTEEEEFAWLELIEKNVPAPNVLDLIFYSNEHGLGDNPRAEEIVEKMLSYKPIVL